ncbi:MAG: diguanylate cyclase [Bacillota bacterium]|nr:diguanylate cyclase [Bacillota bacterium]
MNKKTDSLLFKLSILFVFFTILIMGITGILTYREQTRSYENECQERIQNVGRYLSSLMEADGEEFIAFQNYLIHHRDELSLPVSFSTDYREAKNRMISMLAEHYPGRTVGIDFSYEDLDAETARSFALYNYIYWTGVFEKARNEFGVIYTYYITPAEEPFHMYYVIDGVRMEKEDGSGDMIICFDVHEPPEKHEKMWEAWNTGIAPEGYDIYDDEYEYGNTYAYYTPLIIHNKKIGVIGAEIEIQNVNRKILKNSIRLGSEIGLIILLASTALLLFIKRFYIDNLRSLQRNVGIYAETKDVTIAHTITRDIRHRNEITALSSQIAAMILELDTHMKNLLAARTELSVTREQMQVLGLQAERDALTGIRNRLAYDNEVNRIEYRMTVEDFTAFGIAMIDLNFLKRINDNYGHDKGNFAIKRICEITCRTFTHSPVFRLGGDEFVVILENEDYLNAETLVEQFRQTLRDISLNKSLSPWEQVSAAIGWTRFTPGKDEDVQSVFKRADSLMYENKTAMKAARTD